MYDDQDKEYLLKQKNIIAKQDELLDQISAQMPGLKQVAIEMGDEITKHNVLLDDLENQVNDKNNKLHNVIRKTNKVHENTKSNTSLWLIVGLIFVIVIAAVLIFTL